MRENQATVAAIMKTFCKRVDDSSSKQEASGTPNVVRPRALHCTKPSSMQLRSGVSVPSLTNVHSGPCTCRLCMTSSAFRSDYRRIDDIANAAATSSYDDKEKKESFECSICGSMIASKRGLKIHMRKHSGEKPFSCQVCGRRFVFSSSRSRHMRVHSGDRPHKCDKCDKAFSASSNLSRHKRLRHDG